MAEHNHMTRDIKPLWGGCRGCDEYHVNALQMRVAELRDQIDAARAEVERLRSPEWEAEVRADERERIVAELEGPARESEAMYVHAEQVAARLVEVICEQDDLIQIVGVDATNHRAAAADMRRERDAARADVEFWKTQSQCNADMAAGFLAARDTARAEVAALRKQEWAAPYRREVLADLRAEVLGLEHEDECVTRWQPRDLRRKKRPCDCLIADVITKIEEAGR